MVFTEVEEVEVKAPLAGEEGGAARSGDAVVPSITEIVLSHSSMLGALRRERWLTPSSPNLHFPK